MAEQAQAAEYTAQDIQVLEGMEAVRRRPGMYVGSTDQRGLHQLVYEVVDNAVDEFMAGRCSQVNIHIKQDGRVWVEDDGAGFFGGEHLVGGHGGVWFGLVSLVEIQGTKDKVECRRYKCASCRPG